MNRIVISAIVSFLIVCFGAFADEAAAIASLDPATVSGRLPNGMEYYVLKNNVLSKRARISLIVKTGSLDEKLGEQGIAHMVEHMEFQGTSRYKADAIVSYMESIGMKFGPEVNAETGYYETNYFLSIPTDNETALKNGIDILDEWARGPVVNKTALENEKKVVAEESRFRLENSQGRLVSYELQTFLSGSRYADRMPIGKPGDVAALTAKSISAFVDAHYVPSAMSVIVVGDIDPVAVEKILKKRFTSAYGRSPDSKPSEIPAFPFVSADSVSFLYGTGIGQDIFKWFRTPEPAEDSPEAFARQEAISRIALQAANIRLSALKSNLDTGVGTVSVEKRSYFGKDSELVYILVPLAGMQEPALYFFLSGLGRMASSGLTQNEFDLGIKSLNDENEANRRMNEGASDEAKASWIASAIVEGKYYPFTSAWYELRKKIAASISKKDVDDWLARTIFPSPAKLLVCETGKEGEKKLSASDIAAIEARVQQSAAAPSVAAPTAQQLIAKVPEPGQVISTESVPGTPFSKWILSNGIVAYVYRNGLAGNQLRFRAFAKGGVFLAGDSSNWYRAWLSFQLSRIGSGGLDSSALSQFLYGRRLSFSAATDWTMSLLSGTCDASDPECMDRLFQLVYAHFAAPRRDVTAEKALCAYIRELYAPQSPMPEFRYVQALEDVAVGGDARGKTLGDPVSGSFDPDGAAAIGKRLFGNPADFTFVITGDFSEARLRTLLESWVASLPTGPAASKSVPDLGIRPSKGPVARVVRAGRDDKSAVTMLMYTDMPYDSRDEQRMAVLQNIIAIRLRENLRQDKGGTYYVDAESSVAREPYSRAVVSVRFSCAPGQRESLVRAASAELDLIRQGNIDDGVFAKAVEISRQEIALKEKTNDYWNVSIVAALANGADLKGLLTLRPSIAKITKAEVATLAAKTLSRQPR